VNWSIVQSDAAAWLSSLEDDSADLLVCSPPYEAARTYGIDFKLRGQAWVDWMVEIVKAASPKVKGLIAIVCEGQTRKFAYSATPFLLMADLHRAGFNLRKPPVFHRIGIPGSGGPDWLRNDYEPVVCISRSGKLPWSNNTACGHPPKWAPGGAMAHRLSNGSRVNQCGHPIASGATVVDGEGVVRSKGKRPSHVLVGGRDQWGGTGHDSIGEGRKTDGRHKGRRITKQKEGMHGGQDNTIYSEPAIANPGNVIACKVGGGLMGHDLAHENEAPYPLTLAEFFVRSFCPPGGLVLDCFSGSGTTGHAAVKWGRRFAGCDVRESQVDLCKRRLSEIQPELFT
jgi:hypothetical protein